MSCSIRVYGGQHYVSVICTCSDCEAGRPCPHQTALKPPSVSDINGQINQKSSQRNFSPMKNYEGNCVPLPPPPPPPPIIPYKEPKPNDNIYVDMRGNQNFAPNRFQHVTETHPNFYNNNNNKNDSKILDDKERLSRNRLPLICTTNNSLLNSKRFDTSNFENQNFMSNQIKNLIADSESSLRPPSISSDPDSQSRLHSDTSWRNSYSSRPSSASLDLRDYIDISANDSSIWNTSKDCGFSDPGSSGHSVQYDDSLDSSSLSREIRDTFNDADQSLLEEEFTSPW